MSINKLTKLSLLIIFITISHLAKSQDTIVTYMDNNWKPTKIKKAKYFRKAFETQDNKWGVNDYYMDGKLQMTGFFKSKKLEVKDGEFKYYYNNGTVRSEGIYLNGKYDGEWNWYRKDGSLASKEIYKLGDAVDYSFYNNDGSLVTEKGKIHQKPEFIGGDNALRKFIATSVKYPKEAQKHGVQGKVFVSFVIDPQGNVKNVKVAKSVDIYLDAEAIRVVESMPKWIPAKQHNLPVNINYTVPINFALR